MNQPEFHKYYEEESERIFTELNKLNEDVLLEIIAGKKKDRYNFRKGNDNYQIWRVFQTKGTEKSIKPLFEIVSNLKNEYLIRYHACNALFKIADLNDDEFKGQVQFGLNAEREKIDQQQAIEKLRTILKIEN